MWVIDPKVFRCFIYFSLTLFQMHFIKSLEYFLSMLWCSSLESCWVSSCALLLIVQGLLHIMLSVKYHFIALTLRRSDVVLLLLSCATFQAFAFAGFFVAVLWIKAIAGEIINILQVTFFMQIWFNGFVWWKCESSRME